MSACIVMETEVCTYMYVNKEGGGGDVDDISWGTHRHMNELRRCRALDIPPVRTEIHREGRPREQEKNHCV